MDPMITAPPVSRGVLVQRRDISSGSLASSTGGSSSSISALDTCGYLSGDYASPLTCGAGYTCSNGPSLIPSHLGCCNAVNCAPSSGAHTCITAESGSIDCTGSLSTACIAQYTSLLFCTDATAPACVTYSQPPPSSGSLANGFSPTIFSYACGPTQTTHIYLATATNAPPSASHHKTPSFTNLPIWAYVCIGIGVALLLALLYYCTCNNKPNVTQPNVTQTYGHDLPQRPQYRCRHCGNLELTIHTVNDNNPNGNRQRNCLLCENRNCSNYRNSPGGPTRGWVTWLDAVGVYDNNPRCYCGHPSRLDQTGYYSNAPGRPFYTCKNGACSYTQWLN